MKSLILILAVIGLISVAVITCSSNGKVQPAPNGIAMPEGYEDWRIIGVSQRTDNATLRAILGNDIAVEAARQGNTNPWPDGSILAKLVWKNHEHEAWPAAIVPGEFLQVEFMMKDAARFASTAGWGFARWRGLELTPYGQDAGFAKECVDCHTPVRDNDFVFTRPAVLP